MTRVLFFGTHPNCYNGYCIVTYNLAKELAKKKDIELTIYGFQNFYNNPSHIRERELPGNVFVYDAFANENPKHMGFGFDQVTEFVSMNKPDICVIYNDMVVVSNIMNKLKEVKNHKFKIMVYIDQVYLHQKQEYIKKLNEEADHVLCFTPYWEDIAKGLGIIKPTAFLQHGFDPRVHYPIPKPLARQYFGLKKEDFIVLNLNRNQPRKRWDTCLQAFADFVSKHMEDPVKLLIATSVNGAWNLMEVYERELKKHGFTLEQGMKHIILIDNPQQLTDEDINILYNVADIGINTCDGEGFGLCNFEQAAIGTPQIVPFIGGFRDFFDETCAITVEPKLTFYIDGARDGVGGEAQLCDWRDFSNALERYYKDAELRKTHGEASRARILKNYKWADLGEKFYGILKDVCGHPRITEILPTEKNLNIASLLTADISSFAPKKEEAGKKKVTKKTVDKKKEETRERLKNKLANRAKPATAVPAIETDNLDKDSLLELKQKIEKLLQEK